MRVVLLGDLDLGEEIPVELQCRRQVIERLLEVPVLQVRLSELRIRRDQDEEVLLVDVDEQFAKGELLDADLDHAVRVLRQSELVQRLVPLN